MDAPTEAALRKSILAWREKRRLVEGDSLWLVDMSPAGCSLCARFATDRANSCLGCPIYEHTGKLGCIRTPYDQAMDSYHIAKDLYDDDDYEDDPDYHEAKKDLLSAIDAELAFLRSLLPKRMTKP